MQDAITHSRLAAEGVALGRPTKAQAIHEALAAEIALGRLAPGSPLDEATVARQFGASRTPVREAIRQLEAIGLVAVRPRCGAVVAHVSERQLDDMFSVMAEMEGLCARWAALGMTATERSVLAHLHETGRQLVRDGDIAAYAGLNTRFHEAIYEGAHNGFLVELTHQVRQRCAPFRQAQFEELGRLGRSHAEHDRVVRAIQRGNADGAGAAMRAHLAVVRTAVESARTDGVPQSP